MYAERYLTERISWRPGRRGGESAAGERTGAGVMPYLGHGGEYRRRTRSSRRSISAHQLLLTVVIVLTIAVIVGMVLRGDPGPALGVDEWAAPSARAASSVLPRADLVAAEQP